MRNHFILCFLAFLACETSAQTLNYSTTFGSGSGATQSAAVALDTNDNVYVTGNTTATNLATPGAWQTNFTGTQDAFVAEFDPNGSLIFCTYLGGTAAQSGQGIALDTNGNIYVAGYTSSTNFPTVNPLQATNAGGYDAFVSVISAGGSALAYSTYLGGKSFDSANGLVLDSTGSPIITGYTESTNFPTANAAQPLMGGLSDAFVTKFVPGGSALAYSTFLGGSNTENGGPSYTVGIVANILATMGGAIAADPAGNAYVAGWTYSTNFPVTNAFQTNNPAYTPGSDAAAFVTKLDPAGNVVYSTYFGGRFGDFARAIGVDFLGDVYFGGNSVEGDLPVTNAFQTNFGGGYNQLGDAYLAGLDTTGTNLLYCTYLGGSGDEQINGIRVTADGRVAVIGQTSSPNFPLLNAVQSNGFQGVLISGDGGSTWSASKSGLPSGDITALTVDPFNSSTIFALAGNLCRSSDYGQHWTAVNNDFTVYVPYSSYANLIAFDPVHAGTIYYGAYEGVWKSTDDGLTWTVHGLPSSPELQALAVDPTTPATVYAGTYSAGVFKSIDGGTNWTAMNTGLTHLEVTDVLVDPLNSANVYAGIATLTSVWLYKSTNGGTNWNPVSGLPSFDSPVSQMAFSPLNPTNLYVLVGNFLANGVLCLSTNGGASWSQILQALNVQVPSLAVSSAASPALSIGRGGVNNNISWPASFPGYALQATPGLNPGQWQNVTQAAVSNGASFTTVRASALTEEFYRLAYTNAAPLQPVLYLGTDQASQQGILGSRDGGNSWQALGLGGTTIKALAADPKDPNRIYAGSPASYDIFVATFDAGGTLFCSTYLGGSGTEAGWGIETDGSSVYAVGSSASPDFPSVASSHVVARPATAVFSPTIGGPITSKAVVADVSRGFPCPPDESYTQTVKVNQYFAQGLPRFYAITTQSGSLPPGVFSVTSYDSAGAPYEDFISGAPSAKGTYVLVLNFESLEKDDDCTWTVTLTVVVK